MSDLTHSTCARAAMLSFVVYACGGVHDHSVQTAAGAGAERGGHAANASPKQVARSLAMSASHVCALRQAGLYCWGENFAGQLGTGQLSSVQDAPAAASAAGLDIAEVAADTGRTCVRRNSGEVACWGANDQGQIGDGTRVNSLVAVPAEGIDDATQIAIDDRSTCALRANGRVACWGASPESSADAGSLLPVDMPGLSSIIELRGGVLGTYCARDVGGSVRCWRLQDGAWMQPQEITPLSGARAVAVTFQDELCAITSGNEILCHNLNSGHTVALASSSGTVELVSGELSVCARREDRTWSCWNVLPSMLDTIGSPEVAFYSEVALSEITIGGLKLCALRADGEVACADANSLTSSPTLVVVNGLPR
jgi:hypothetical protein